MTRTAHGRHALPAVCQQPARPAVNSFCKPQVQRAAHGRASNCCRHTSHTAKQHCCCSATDQVYVESSTSPAANGAAQPGFIFGQGQEGAWDSGGVGSPVVRCYFGDDEQRWYMWYNGHSSAATADGSGAPTPVCVGLATSSDGVRWLRGGGDIQGQQGALQEEDVGRVLGPNPDWWWHDTRGASVSDVQIFSSDTVNTGVGVYWMFYSGASFEEVLVPAGMSGLPDGQEVEGLRTRAGLAMSQDGRNWARIEANHHTGALFDVGEDGQWDGLLVGAPQVLALAPNDMRMYYHSYDTRQRKWVVGWATSADGFKWSKQGPIFAGGQDATDFDAGGAAAHHVVKDVNSRRFVMFYEAVSAEGGRSISIAVSKDGIGDWQRLGRPILEPSDAGWDSGAVGCPCPVSMADGRWRLYYAGRSEKEGQAWDSIGLALTDPADEETFEGVRVAFKRRSKH